ncbi:MAG: hypothetical protein OK455_09535 [Thaumarchaeota archaeon]|nr:hypothetical protein [Nitrososphaerota archaeon]
MSVASVVNMDTLESLAREFKNRFETSSGLIHERLAGKEFIFNNDGKDAYPFAGWSEASDTETYPIVPGQEQVTIASTDSSCILLGESFEGCVYAVRAAVTFSCAGLVRGYFRVGPTIVYLSQRGVYGLPSDLEPYELRMAISDHLIAERIIRNTVEKRIVAALVSSPQVSIVMADGSLKHPFDVYPASMTRSDSDATLVGFSKSSSLVASSRLTGTVSKAIGPAFCAAGEGPVQTLVAKFSNDGLVFRLDVARPREHLQRVLGLILSNDGFSVGYPESLRVAHHLSVFSRSEDTALKAYLTRRYRLKHLPAFGLRRMTLGSLSNSG